MRPTDSRAHHAPGGSPAAELLRDGAARLAGVGGASARLEAQLLLGRATGRTRTELLAHPERSVPAPDAAAFNALVARREAAEPIAYVLGEREFYGRVFRVDRRALIPRPETELLVELGVAAVARWRAAGVEPKVVDVGTGCGAIAISVALEAGVPVLATDLSRDALALASDNAVRLGSTLRAVQTDLVAGLRGPLQVVLANLPYVPRGRNLPRDVKDYEPALAIFGGARGTETIERLLYEVRPLLVAGAEVCVELDEQEQARPVAVLAGNLYPGAAVSVCQDAGGYDRVCRVQIS